MIMKNNKDKEYKYKRSTFYHNNKQYVCYGKTQTEADKKAAIKQKALENGEIGISNKMTIKRWCYIWLETYKKSSGLTAMTYKNYKRFIDNDIIPEIGNTKISDVKATHLQIILNNCKGKSESNLSKLRFVIKDIFKKAQNDSLINKDIAKNLELPKTNPVKARRSITDSERTMILKAAETHHFGLIAKLMLYTGMRNGEVIALDWIDIDLHNKRVYVSKAKECGSNNIKAPKTDAGIREIPLPDVLVNDLVEAKQGRKPHDPVFIQIRTGKRYTDKGFILAWNNFLRHMDIENGAVVFNNKIIKSVIASDLTPYYLRHTFCTDLQIAGVELDVARRLMGHTNISITSKIYTHASNKVTQAAADKMNKYHNSIAS